MSFSFKTTFRNVQGAEVAGTWFDEEKQGWRVSTVPIRSFLAEQDAVRFFSLFCDSETGLPNTKPRYKVELGNPVLQQIRIATVDNEQSALLIGELEEALLKQKQVVGSLRALLTKQTERSKSRPVGDAQPGKKNVALRTMVLENVAPKVLFEQRGEMQSATGESESPTRLEQIICTGSACEEGRRLLSVFGETLRELVVFHEQQFLAIVEGDSEFNRFDVLIHMAAEKKQQAKYVYLQHLESHGCKGN